MVIHRPGLQTEAFVSSQMNMGAMQHITNDNLVRCDQLWTVASHVRWLAGWPGFITMATKKSLAPGKRGRYSEQQIENGGLIKR